MKRATLKDIAAALEVNPSTISRALNNHPDVSAEMREKVKQVAELLHYIPNITAVNLKAKKTKTIGLIIPTISKFFIPSIINGIASILNQNGYRLVILSSDESVEKEKEHIKMCCYTQMDGIIISLTNQTNNTEHLKLADEFEIPIVMFDKILPQQKYSTIVINDLKAAAECTQYLLDKNCKNILGIFGNKNLEITSNRYAGMLHALANDAKIKHQIIFADSMEDAKIKTNEALKKHKTIDGVFCMSDEVLTGATAAMHIQNKLFTICTTAITDGQLIDYRVPKIAYVKHDGEKMGNQAAIQLLHHLNSNQAIDYQCIEMDTMFHH